MAKIVGISGATNGGKTSLSRRLEKIYPGSMTINQDEFFREEDDPSHVWITLKSGRKHQNWERLESVDWKSLNAKISATLEKISQGFLIIEGHLIFNYRPFDNKFFMTITKDECLRRRVSRSYVPPDPEGYFDEYVWPMYLLNKKDAEKEHPDMILLDGENDLTENLKKVVNILNAGLESYKFCQKC